MVQFGIQVKGLEGRRDALEMVKFVTKIRKVHVKKLGEETQRVIRRVVQGEIKRPLSTGRLARYASEMEILEQGNEAGVGNLETMDQEVPYWHWCLREDTEAYVKYEDKIVPMTLKDLYKKRDQIEYILSPKGLKKLNRIYKTYPKDKYEVNITKYDPIYCSGDHRFLVKLNKNIIEKKIRDIREKSLKAYHFVYRSLKGLNKEKIIDSIESNGKKLFLDYNYGYMLGFTLGDGCVVSKGRVSVAQKTLETFEMLENINLFCSKFNYSPKIYKEEHKYDIVMYKKEVREAITYFVKGKHEKKGLKNFFLNTPKEFRKGILAGYKYSDGRKKQKTGNQIRTISLNIKHNLLLIASSLGYDISYLQDQKESSTGFKSNFPVLCGSYFYKSRFHYRDQGAKYLKVKKINKDREKRDKKGRFIYESYNVDPFIARSKMLKKKTKIDDNLQYFDLNVEGELFLINGGIVSHNSNFGVAKSGRKRPPASIGRFAPGNPQPSADSFREGRFVQDSGASGGYLMIPTKDIEPMNYIETTWSTMFTRAPSILARATPRATGILG